jgi:hypothetical protein
MTNPLSRYIKTPRLYVKLPTRARFYEPNSVKLSAAGEVAVYALSAIDQIMLKTPDALLNGEALMSVFSHCVPGVANVRELVEPDINTLLLAIKIASSGSSTELEVDCPNCAKSHSFDVNLTSILDSQSFLDDDPDLKFDNDLVLHLRPYNFSQRNLQMLNEIEESQALRIIEANSDSSDSDEGQKMAQLAQHVNRMAERTFDVVSQSISSITIVETGETVQDPVYISEFLKGISKSQADIVINRIRELNQVGINTTTKFECSSCSHEWSQPLDFDPSSFFG